MKKLNFASFTRSHLLAKLFIIKSEYERNEIIGRGKAGFMAWVKDKVKCHFIYPEKQEENIINNMALFLLGDTNNKFDKILNNI